MPFFGAKQTPNNHGLPTNHAEAERLYNQSSQAAESGDMATAVAALVKVLHWVVPNFFEEHPYDGKDCLPSLPTFGAFFNSLDFLNKVLRMANQLDLAEKILTAGLNVAIRKDPTGNWTHTFGKGLEGLNARRQYAPEGVIMLNDAVSFDSKGFTLARELSHAVDAIATDIASRLRTQPTGSGLSVEERAVRLENQRYQEQTLLQAVDQLIELRRYDEALHYARQALVLNPNSSDINYALGFCLCAKIRQEGRTTMNLTEANQIAAHLKIAADQGNEYAQELLSKIGE